MEKKTVAAHNTHIHTDVLSDLDVLFMLEFRGNVGYISRKMQVKIVRDIFSNSVLAK